MAEIKESTATENSTSSAVNKGELLKWFITLLVPFIVWMIPMSLESNIKTFLIVASFAVTAWVTVIIPVEVTGVLIPCLLLLLKVAEPAVLFAPWSNTVIWGTVALLLIGLAASSSGLSTRMAYSILIKLDTRLRGLIWGFSIAGFILSFIITDSFIRMIVFMTIAIGICKALGIPAKSKEATALGLAAFFGMAGPSIATMPGGNGLMINSVFRDIAGYDITYIQWLLHNFIPGIVWSAVGALSIIWVLKIGKENSFNAKEELLRRYAELGPMNIKEKITLIFLLMIVANYIFSNSIGLDPLLMPVFLVPFMFLPGIKIISLEDFEKTDYKIFFIMTGAMCIGATAGAVGLIDVLIEYITPLISGSPVKMILGTYICSAFSNFILTPIAIVFTYTGLFTEMATAAGINPLPVLYAMNLGTDVYIFPYEYVILLVGYSFGLMNYLDTIKVLLVRSLGSALAIGAGLIVWKMFGLY